MNHNKNVNCEMSCIDVLYYLALEEKYRNNLCFYDETKHLDLFSKNLLRLSGYWLQLGSDITSIFSNETLPNKEKGANIRAELLKIVDVIDIICGSERDE